MDKLRVGGGNDMEGDAKRMSEDHRTDGTWSPGVGRVGGGQGHSDRPSPPPSLEPLGGELVLSAPLNPRAPGPVSHMKAGLCQVCGMDLPCRHFCTGMEIK